jgi:acyl carrier protein
MPESLISATAAPTPGAGIQVEQVLAIVRRHLPSYWQDRPLSVDLRLDDAGIGFDSVDLLELLVACERELGREMAPDLLLDDAMTLGDLIAKLQGAASAP